MRHYIFIKPHSSPLRTLTQAMDIPSERTTRLKRSPQKLRDDNDNNGNDILRTFVSPETTTTQSSDALIQAPKTNETYGEETVQNLMNCMNDGGYNQKGQQRKSLVAVFESVVELAKYRYGIERTASGWKKKMHQNETRLYCIFVQNQTIGD